MAEHLNEDVLPDLRSMSPTFDVAAEAVNFLSTYRTRFRTQNNMEEVDKIILHSLRQIGCDIDEEVTSLKQFDTEMIVRSTVSCLELIQPGLSLPRSLPHNLAAKYRAGQMIAQAYADIGYPGDIGYQTFLYSAEADLRKVLMFLIEKLPKDQEKFMHEPTTTELLIGKIRHKVKQELNRPWLPVICSRGAPRQHFLSFTNITLSPSAAWKEFCMQDLPSASVDRKYLVPTAICLHLRGILAKAEPQWQESSPRKIAEDAASIQLVPQFAKNSIGGQRKPPVPPKPKPRRQVTSEGQTKDRQEEEILTNQVEQLVHRVQQLYANRQQLLQQTQTEEAALAERREKDALGARILQLLPHGERSVAALQEALESAAQRILSLSAQWEKHRVPLIGKYRRSVEVQSSRMNESMRKAETARSLGEKRRELEAELKSKEQMLGQLQSESERNGKEVNRSAYTRRILEIINNIEKQKSEIDKVLRDTREIQKEINTLSGQLDRSFTVADETIFRDAKKDESSRKAYKLLATLHTDCDQLVAMVQETGAILREIRDLEDQIEKEKSKNISANLERITADLNQMKVESAQLSAQLRLKQQQTS